MARPGWLRALPRRLPACVIACALAGVLGASLGVPLRAHAAGADGEVATGAAKDNKASTVRVGRLTLRRCAASEAWCGTLERALDPGGAVPGVIPIHFEFYRHLDTGPSTGTLVATEGGPGFAATESRASYLALYRPLRGTRDVVIMDNRGTGGSGAIDCPTLQRVPTLTEDAVAACGALLGARAPFYSTTLAADDLEAVLDALGTGAVDLYGDSYGTFFAQVFAVRHPQRLRSLVLDGAYPLGSGDYAWYPAYAPAMRDKFNFACERSAACSALPGNSTSRIEQVLRSLRERPFVATGQDLAGKPRHFVADPGALAIVMFGSAPALPSVRELDAAARAFTAGDRLPLMRLMAESQVNISSTSDLPPPREFSAGLAAAVMCQDAPQIYDMALAPAQRRLARDRAVAQRERQAPETYAPFTIAEYRRLPLDYSFIDECVAWPAPPADRPAGVMAPAPLKYPPAPTLVVSGDLDNMTPVADGTAAAANFPNGRQLIIRNGFHVNALPHARADCGAIVVRHFIDTLSEGDTSCARSVPSVRLVPLFARHVSELEPAVAGEANTVGRDGLQAVTAAVQTAGDALARAGEIAPGSGVGLRGGRYGVRETPTGYRVTLRSSQWTEDLAVSGWIESPRREGRARAVLDLAGSAGFHGRLDVRWTEGPGSGLADVQGRINGQRVSARVSAP